MASVGFRIGGTDYDVLVADEDDAREELVEFASFAGKSAQAFEFARVQSLTGYSQTTLNDRKQAPGFFEGLMQVPTAVAAVLEPAGNYLDFDTQKLVLGERTFDLEWLGRGGVVELPSFVSDHKTAHSQMVQRSVEGKPVEDKSGYNGVAWGDNAEHNVVSSRMPVKQKRKPIPGNLFFEELEPQEHRPLIDIDFEAALIPSSTKGRYHLYLDKAMPEDKYLEFLEELTRFGIIAEGNLNQMKRDGATFLRFPWVKKGFLG